jgi:transcriptional regulator with XRE-family HTH domain
MSLHMSTTPQPLPPIGQLLAKHRADKALSLQELSGMSGVSKGMISQIENGQVNPTLAIVWKLAHGLGVRLQDLLEVDAAATADTGVSYLTEENCPTLASAKSGYSVQILSTVDMAEKVELYLVTLKPDGVMDSRPHSPGTMETLTVVQGDVEVVSGNSKPFALARLQSVRYRADVRHIIRNTGTGDAFVYLAVKFPEATA